MYVYKYLIFKKTKYDNGLIILFKMRFQKSDFKMKPFSYSF